MKKISLLILALVLVLTLGLSPSTTAMAAGGPSLQLALSENTPGSHDVVVGSIEEFAMEATFTTYIDDIRVDSLVVKAFRSENSTASPAQSQDLCNVKLYEKNATGGTIVAGPVSVIGGNATFTSVNWTITKETPKNLRVTVDIPSGCQASALFLTIEGKDISATSSTPLTPVSGSANGSIMKIVPHGSLIISLAPDTPPRRIVAVGDNGTEETATKINFTALNEDIDITSITVRAAVETATDFSKISLWDGETEIVVPHHGLVDASTTFNFPPWGYWRVPKGSTKTLTIKAGLNGIATQYAFGSNSGDAPWLYIKESEVTAVGAISGSIFTPDPLYTAVGGNEMILRKSKPYIAAASLPTNVLVAGENVFWRGTITADQKGNVDWKTKVFEMTGEIYVGQNTFVIGSEIPVLTDAVYMHSANGTLEKLIPAQSLQMRNMQTGDSINSTLLILNLPDRVLINFAASENQTIVAGNTKAYELRGTALYGKGFIATKIPNGNVIPNNEYIGNASFTWTDGVAWATDYLVPGIPTATLSLENGSVPTPTPTITVISPNGGEQWETNETHLIKWTSAGYNTDASIQIGLRDGRYDPNLAKGEITIANTTNNGSYNWTIPSTVEAGSFFKIVIYIDGGGPGKCDLSDNNFQITQATTPSIQVLSPNGGETWQIGNTYTITWASNAMDKLQIVLTDANLDVGEKQCILNNGNLVPEGLKAFTFNLGTCLNTSGQTVNISPGNYKVRLCGPNEGYPCDYSDNCFSIVTANVTPSITVLSPNGGEKWEIGKTYRISWKSVGVDNVSIELGGNDPSWPSTIRKSLGTFSASTGFYDWTVSSDLRPANLYGISVISYETGFPYISDASDGYFSIVAPTLTVEEVRAMINALLAQLAALQDLFASMVVNVEIDAPTKTEIGSEFSVGLCIEEVENLDACNYDVMFDPAILQLTEIRPGQIASKEFPLDISNEREPGHWTIIQNLPGLTGITGSGYLAILRFKVIGDVSGETEISLANGVLSNTLAKEIPSVWGKWFLEITYAPGDANHDGQVNAIDITKVERYIAGLD